MVVTGDGCLCTLLEFVVAGGHHWKWLVVVVVGDMIVAREHY